MGTIHAFKGSPDKTGTFYTGSTYPPDDVELSINRQAAIQAKIGAMIKLFSTDNQWFEIQPWDGSAPVKFKARLKSINFDNGPWFDVCKYNIVFETECIYFGSNQVCAYDNAQTLVDETWEIEPVDDTLRAYRVSHSLSSQFPDAYDDSGVVSQLGWLRAKAAVEAKYGIGSTLSVLAGTVDLSLFTAYNHIRQVSENVTEGSYHVNESWVCFQPQGDNIPAIEDYTLTTRETGGLVNVSINGTITGLFSRNSTNFDQITTTKQNNAEAKWAIVQTILPTRAQSATSALLNPTPITRQKVENFPQGIISYNYEYNSRSSFGLTGVKSVNVNVQDVNPTDVFASIPTINRAKGPILQPIGTVTERKRIISVDITLTPVGYDSLYPPFAPDVSGIITYYAPSALLYSQIFLAEDTSNASLGDGRYQRVVAFVFQ